MKQPACRGKAECDVYCSAESHFQECLDFARAAGLVSPEEAKNMQATGGKGPGGCRGKECENYCDNESHLEACLEFSVQTGMMTAREARVFQKTKGRGPGGCKGELDCSDFCKDFGHNKACLEFDHEIGGISDAEWENLVSSNQGLVKNLLAPHASLDCVKNVLGEKKTRNTLAGQNWLVKSEVDAIETCLFVGPGGCRNPVECSNYCADPAHTEECDKFSAD